MSLDGQRPYLWAVVSRQLRCGLDSQARVIQRIGSGYRKNLEGREVLDAQDFLNSYSKLFGQFDGRSARS